MNASEIKDRTVYVLCRTDKPEDGTDIYIGSTSQPLRKRLAVHRYRDRNFIKRGCSDNNKLYMRMGEVGVQNWKIISLLTFACDINTIREFEKCWVQVLNADLNTYSPIREEETIKECYTNYRKNNKEAIREYFRNNKKSKWYYCRICDITCECKRGLTRHIGTLKHQYTYINSLD